jgi:hypothetical protein
MRFKKLDSGLAIPYSREKEAQELRDKRKVEQKELMQKYRDAHQRCPECNGDQIEETCMGTIQLTEDYVDSNYAYCGCGWKGIVDDLLPFNHIRHMGDVLKSRCIESKLPICPICNNTKDISKTLGTVPCIAPARNRLTCEKCRVSWDMTTPNGESRL